MSNNNLPVGTNNGGGIDTTSGKIWTQVYKSILENRITRNNPCAVVLLVDQSGSMSRVYTNTKNEVTTFADEVANSINQFFDYLILRCTSGTDIREYFVFTVIGYGNIEEDNIATFVWEGNLSGKKWVSVKELHDNILETKIKIEKRIHPWNEEYDHKTTEKIWIHPNSEGNNTPMLAALKLCKDTIEEFIENKSDNFPPIVFNMTDGRPTDVSNLNEITEVCNEIKSIDTSFGNTILFNCLLSSNSQNRLFLPRFNEISAVEGNAFHLTLFECSSVLPDFILEEANKVYKDEKYAEGSPIIGLVLNVEPSNLLQLFKIGTRTTK